jgi:hypothetical protein
LLRQLRLPPGAVRTGLQAGIPADLWSPIDPVPATHRADVHALWRVPLNAQHLLDFIHAHRPTGSLLREGAEGGSSSAGLTSWTEDITFPVRPGDTIWRALTLQADAIAGGATVLRADAQAGPLIPRPAGERIPAAVDSVVISNSRSGSNTLVLGRRRVGALVALFNGLPLEQPGVPRKCARAPAPRLTYSFYLPHRTAPAAIIAWNTACPVFQVTVAGRRQPTLALISPIGLTASTAQLTTLLSASGLDRGWSGGGKGAAAGQAATRR